MTRCKPQRLVASVVVVVVVVVVVDDVYLALPHSKAAHESISWIVVQSMAPSKIISRTTEANEEKRKLERVVTLLGPIVRGHDPGTCHCPCLDAYLLSLEVGRSIVLSTHCGFMPLQYNSRGFQQTCTGVSLG